MRLCVCERERAQVVCRLFTIWHFHLISCRAMVKWQSVPEIAFVVVNNLKMVAGIGCLRCRSSIMLGDSLLKISQKKNSFVVFFNIMLQVTEWLFGSDCHYSHWLLMTKPPELFKPKTASFIIPVDISIKGVIWMQCELLSINFPPRSLTSLASATFTKQESSSLPEWAKRGSQNPCFSISGH